MPEHWSHTVDWGEDDRVPNTSGRRPSELLDLHRESIRRIVAENNAANPRVFGSVLNGTDTINSDLDIIVDEAGRLSLLDIGAIRVELRDLLGVPVDVVTPGSLPEKFRQRVISEAVAV